MCARSQRRPRYRKTLSTHRTPPIHAERFHIIQEQVAHDLYELLVAASLWNRTKGVQARPVFHALMRDYPTPDRLANASQQDLAQLLRPIGLQNSRSKRLLDFARAWLCNPPDKIRRYRKLHYPQPNCGKDVGRDEVLGEDDPRPGWEIAHLPGIGPYALDSFRIFHRDVLRGLATDWTGTGAVPGFEPEWKRVQPQDKELKAYIRWMWLKEGLIWNPASGRRLKASAQRMRHENARDKSLSPQPL